MLRKSETDALNTLVKRWLKKRGISQGAIVKIELVPNQVIIRMGSSRGSIVSQGNRTVLRELSNRDWYIILNLPIKRDLKNFLKRLKKKNNEGIGQKKNWQKLNRLVNRINVELRKNETIYRLTHVHGGGDQWHGPFQIAVLG